MVTPLQNNFFISMPTPPVKVKELGTGLVDLEGKPLTITRDDRVYLPQLGAIRYAPKIIKGFDYEIPIKAGDSVYLHHFCRTPTFQMNINGEELYWQNYNELYAIQTEDDVIPLERYVFIEPIMEREDEIVTPSGIFIKPKAEAKHLTGTVRYASALAKRLGVSVGDTVRYYSRAQYPVKMKSGDVFWKTRVDNIHFIE